MGKERLELSTLAGLAPKASAYTNSATYPNKRIIPNYAQIINT